MFSTPAMLDAVSDRAWLQAMLDVEAALALAQATLGMVPEPAALAIAERCQAELFDIDALGAGAVAAAVPVVPMVDALKALVPPEAAIHVHAGATSQDILDSAAMLVARNALDLIDADVALLADGLAALAREHRETIMAGRTLMQQAVPITFGLKAAGWLTAVLDAHDGLLRVRQGRLAAQLGGAAGTLAAFGPRALELSGQFARELALPEPALPWHTARGRIADIASACAIASGACGKIALDVTLLMQSEVGEAFEPAAPGKGRSSAMPQKRNPVGAIEVNAGVRRVNALAGVIFASMAQEHERAAGAWQAEWDTISDTFALTAGVVAHTREIIGGLEVDPVRMRANLDAGRGLAMAEQAMTTLAAAMPRGEARALVDRLCASVLAQGLTLLEALQSDAAVTSRFTPDEVRRMVDPVHALGAAASLTDRALAAYDTRRNG